MRILVIDDEYVALKKMKHLLDPYGDVDIASGAKQALEMYTKAYWDKRMYDLFTIDIDMPEMNGIELLERICHQEELLMVNPAKKIMVTAESTAENLAKAYKKKSDDFVVKPVLKHILDKKLDKLGFQKIKDDTIVP